MDRINPAYWWRLLLTLPNDSRAKTLVVALLVAMTSASVVATTSVLLRPLQVENLERERQAQVSAVIAAAIGEPGPLAIRMVDLQSGQFVPDIDPVTFDQRAAARDPATSIDIPSEIDIAGLGRRAKHAPVFLREMEGRIDLIVLPVHGQGYQSTLYGYLALRGDFNTVAALTFYEHGETPGLGSVITEPSWQANWQGRQVSDDAGTIRIAVSRGRSASPYEVDGISGATRTGLGVTNLLRYWLGNHGFGPLLDRLRKESS